MDNLTKEIISFIENLDAKVAYEAQLSEAVSNEDYERAEKIKRNMEKECK